MLCVEDALDGLNWAERVGGLNGLIRAVGGQSQGDRRLGARTRFGGFPGRRSGDPSSTSICLKIIDPWFGIIRGCRPNAAKPLASLFEKESVAYDIAAYRDAPAGMRIWGGGTVEASRLAALMPWLDWAFAQVAADDAAWSSQAAP